jgi:deoxyribonuclease V
MNKLKSHSFYESARQVHKWDPTPAEAKQIQRRLRKQLLFEDRLGQVHTIAGADVGFNSDHSISRAAMVTLSVPDLKVIEKTTAELPTPYTYIPGLLSFREVPVLLKAMDKMKVLPDVILSDSQGYAHPRRFGLACHLGILTDIPTVGVAKSKLIGEYEALPPEKGASVPLIDQEERVGLVLRSRTDVTPLFVSVGHQLTLETAKSLVMQPLTRYRLPETTGQPDQLASNT